MSATNSLHYQLCIEGAKWLHKQKFNYDRCKKKQCHNPEFCRGCKRYKYVAVELCTWGSENTDVWGLANFNDSVVIEVKTSHSDFMADKKKWCRGGEAERLGLQAGALRWYLCPEGVIKREELPEKWGLLYWDGKRIYPVKGPEVFEGTAVADMAILTSILRREQFPESIFNYRVMPPTQTKQFKIEFTRKELDVLLGLVTKALFVLDGSAPEDVLASLNEKLYAEDEKDASDHIQYLNDLLK